MIRMLAAACAALLIGAAPLRAETIFDVVADFSIASNPNGPWTYGTGTPGGTVTPFAFSDRGTIVAAGTPLPAWSSPGSPFNVPAVYVNDTGGVLSDGAVTWSQNTLYLHPGQSAAEAVAVRFTAPSAGFYTYFVRAFPADNNTAGVGFSAFLNATVLEAHSVMTPNNNPSASSFGAITLAAGDTMTFFIDPDADFYSDTVGLQARFALREATPPTGIPEPATFALMAFGLGCLGAVRRRA